MVFIASTMNSVSPTDVTSDAHAQTGSFDLDLGQVGLIQQHREFADQAAVVGRRGGGRLGGGFLCRLAGHGVSIQMS